MDPTRTIEERDDWMAEATVALVKRMAERLGEPTRGDVCRMADTLLTKAVRLYQVADLGNGNRLARVSLETMLERLDALPEDAP